MLYGNGTDLKYGVTVFLTGDDLSLLQFLTTSALIGLINGLTLIGQTDSVKCITDRLPLHKMTAIDLVGVETVPYIFTT